MPHLETVSELAEAFADACGVYNQGLLLLPDEQGHAEACTCQMCWCGRIETRIRQAVKNEEILSHLQVCIYCNDIHDRRLACPDYVKQKAPSPEHQAS